MYRSKVFDSILVNDGGTFAVEFGTGIYRGFHAFDSTEFDSGYIVAAFGLDMIIPVTDFEPFMITSFIENRADELSAPNTYFGAWVNDGNVYLDVVSHIADREFAIALGKQNAQLAIWDCAKNEEIAL